MCKLIVYFLSKVGQWVNFLHNRNSLWRTILVWQFSFNTWCNSKASVGRSVSVIWLFLQFKTEEIGVKCVVDFKCSVCYQKMKLKSNVSNFRWIESRTIQTYNDSSTDPAIKIKMTDKETLWNTLEGAIKHLSVFQLHIKFKFEVSNDKNFLL